MINFYNKNFYIVMPAYKASKTIYNTIKKIPKDVYDIIKEIVIIEDIDSKDEQSTSEELLNEYKKCKVIFHEKNRGYGAAQKTGYKYCMRKQCDGIVLLHSDAQYAPEYLKKFIDFILVEKIDVVQGSRMLIPKDAIRGGMPLYKYILNKVITALENFIFNTKYSEFHSGYVGYSSNALKKIAFEKLSNTFHFDGEMLIMTKLNKLSFKSFPIETHYGKESSSLNPISYGFQIVFVIVKFIFNFYNMKADENRFN